MTGDWTATVQRINPATDVLVVKCAERINLEQADRIKRAVNAVMPEVRVLVLTAGFETAVISRRRAKTLVRAARSRR